jgi:hypothetical protein
VRVNTCLVVNVGLICGAVHAGDIGVWDANWNLRIVDRKKNIFKLSQVRKLPLLVL